MAGLQITQMSGFTFPINLKGTQALQLSIWTEEARENTKLHFYFMNLECVCRVCVDNAL